MGDALCSEFPDLGTEGRQLHAHHLQRITKWKASADLTFPFTELYTHLDTQWLGEWLITGVLKKNGDECFQLRHLAKIMCVMWEIDRSP